MWRLLQCVWERARETERERDQEKEEEWIRGLLGSSRLCNVSAAAGGSDGRKLQLPVQPAAFSLHNVCLLHNYSSPAAWTALHAAFHWRGGARRVCIYKPLFGLEEGGRKKSSWKRGAFIIFEPITITVSAKPTIVQVFQNWHFSPSAASKNADIWFCFL